jgi:hypothetical protein
MKGQLPKIIVNVGDDFFVMQVADRAASHIVVVRDATPSIRPDTLQQLMLQVL